MRIYLQTIRKSVVIGAMALLAKTSLVATPHVVSPPSRIQGDLGGDLPTLARFHKGPAVSGESNHFIDMWSEGQMIDFARDHGLTNNRALFVISHAKGLKVKKKMRYALYPGRNRATRGSKTSYYSPQDIAQILGPQTVQQIENLIISGCNSENVFNLAEWKTCFPNATNIIHAAPGKDGYDFLLRHALIYRSSEIKWLYNMPDTFKLGRFDEETKPSKNSPSLNLYLASLYRPGANQPFTVQIAGRELLEPPIGLQTAQAVQAAPTVQVAKSVRSVVSRATAGGTELVQPATAATPKVIARREPIIMRGSTARKAQSTSRFFFSGKAWQPDAAMGIIGIVFGACCLTWSFRLASEPTLPAAMRVGTQEPGGPAAFRTKLNQALRRFLSESQRRLRELRKKKAVVPQDPAVPAEPVAEATSQANGAESSRQVD